VPTKTPKWTYGKSPAPKGWGEAADILKGKKKQPKPSKGLDKLDAIEKLLKESK
jgi:hypothetical protein